VWHEPSKTIWESEMGPNGGDEINVIKAGGNHGWPLVSLGRSCAGPYQPGGFQAEGMTAPVVNFVPSISTTGMAFTRARDSRRGKAISSSAACATARSRGCRRSCPTTRVRST
jgi:glucose/arabinose dehydrogenase